MLLLVIAASIIGLTKAQVPFVGSCPELRTMENFDVSRYMGRWYEAERYFYLYEFGGRCVNSNYTEGINNSINLINKQTSSLTGIVSKVEGAVKKADNGTLSSRMSVTFPYLPVDAPYWILETDYDNYSVVWSCTNFAVFSTRNAWILTRQRNPPLEIMEKAYNVLDRKFITRAYFIRTDQKDCSEDN